MLPDSSERAAFDSRHAALDQEAPRKAPWSIRSGECGAEPFDMQRGSESFLALWGADQYIAGLSESERSRLCEHLHFVRVPADKEIISQNEQGDFMVIVLEGALSVERVQAAGANVRLAEANVGDTLGEMSLLDSGTRFSTCRTSTECLLAVVDEARLNAMTQSEPRLALALMASLSRRLSLRLRRVGSRLSALLAGR